MKTYATLRPKIYQWLLAVGLICQSVAQAAYDPELDQLLAKHFDAMGGVKHWHSVESIRLSGTIKRDDKSFEFVIIKKRPNQIRATISIPVPGKDDEMLQIIRAHDGETGWKATRLAGQPKFEKREALDPKEAEEVLRDAGVLPQLVKLWREGANLALGPIVEIDGVECHLIRSFDLEKETEAEFYLSSESFKVVKQVYKTQGQSSETQFKEHTTVEGVQIPTSILYRSNNEETRVNTESVKIGVGIYQEYFSSAPTPSPVKL